MICSPGNYKWVKHLFHILVNFSQYYVIIPYVLRNHAIRDHCYTTD